jgi:RNA polymerase sigma factor (TIGR02999 family)
MSAENVTRLLIQIDAGDPHAAEQLLPLVYDELRKLAVARLANERPGQTLQATALVHEAYLRLATGKPLPSWSGRGHFFAAAAEAMRRILVDAARRKASEKHGAGWQRHALDAIDVADQVEDGKLLALHEALDRLEAKDPQKGRLVKLRYFAGLTIEQAAAALDISTATAERNWTYARAWLQREMG